MYLKVLNKHPNFSKEKAVVGASSEYCFPKYINVKIG